MEENRFEKQVQQKMDELQIQPSDEVWKKIEARIEKKKSRRWGLIILFLCIGLILSGGYWFWNTRQHGFSDNNTLVKSYSEKNNSKDSVIKNKEIQAESNLAPDSLTQKNNEVSNLKQNEDANKNSTKLYKPVTRSRANQKINSSEKTSVAFSGERKEKTEIKAVIGSEMIAAQSSEEQFENKADKKEIKDSMSAKSSIDSLSKSIDENALTKNSDTSGQKQASKETEKQSKKNKWKFGMLITGGISGTGSDFSTLSNFSAYPGSGSYNGGQQSGFSSSVAKAGFGFIGGAFAEKNISKKISLVIGTNYKSFNTSFKLTDSSGRYSAGAATDKYINHFNFIELPVSLKIQIGKGKSIPLFWQSGFTVSELINSNALQFNPSTGYYYKDNSLFNKTQIGFNTAVLVSLFPKQKNSILIGPYFYYDASKIANEGLYNNKHFVFAGLHTEIIFGK
ncbi:MAG TPA: hypothetical protein VNS50_12440 [Ginsengibacter sp.]|nr:hypothetical protein [Ginsengibacter sp.]